MTDLRGVSVRLAEVTWFFEFGESLSPVSVSLIGLLVALFSAIIFLRWLTLRSGGGIVSRLSTFAALAPSNNSSCPRVELILEMKLFSHSNEFLTEKITVLYINAVIGSILDMWSIFFLYENGQAYFDRYVRIIFNYDHEIIRGKNRY